MSDGYKWSVAVVAAVACMPLLAATRPVTLEHPAADAQLHPYCAVLDAEAFSEAAPGLRGLHLMQNGVEIPFLTTVSAPQNDQTDAARILRLREEDGALLFDLGMPPRAYTELVFRLRLRDFTAVAEISTNTRVGEFKLFDLSQQNLSRQTMVELPEMRDGILHVALRATGKVLHADDLAGVDVLPDRAGQSLYTAAAAAETFTSTERETIAELDVAAHVPVQRIRFETDAKSFLRRVRVEAWPLNDPNDVETVSGTISATHRDGLADTQLTVPMTVGANLQGPAHVRVIVENNAEAPLPLQRVALEMREHKVCFDAKSTEPITLQDGGDGNTPSDGSALAMQSWERAGVATIGSAAKGEEVAFVLPKRYPWAEKIVRYLIVALLAWGLIGIPIQFIYACVKRRKNRTR